MISTICPSILIFLYANNTMQIYIYFLNLKQMKNIIINAERINVFPKTNSMSILFEKPYVFDDVVCN